MEDPLFDPWSSEPETQEPAAPPPDQEDTSPSGTRPTGRWKSPGSLTQPARPSAAERPGEGSGAPHPASQLTSTVDGLPGQIREAVLPRVEWLSSRLRIAGHQTTIDDRLDAVVPSLRIRLVPRRYPLVETEGDSVAVLEVTANERRSEVAARLWLDPMATGPTEDMRIQAGRLTDRWIDRLLLEFVERTLEDS